MRSPAAQLGGRTVIEQLTYVALAERLGCSPEAARSLVKRLRLPRQRGNDGKTLVAADTNEIKHTAMPARSPAGHRPDITALKAKITDLEDEIVQLEMFAKCNRADFERERERCDRLMAEMLRQSADLIATKESAVRFEKIAALRSRPWWRRLAG
jgi:hypothetical protein